MVFAKQEISADLRRVMLETTKVNAMIELVDCDDFWFSMKPRYIKSLAEHFPILTLLISPSLVFDLMSTL